MESLLYRYRNITVLLVVLFAQLVLLAWQVKSDKDVPLVRVWAVSAVAPVASAIETVRNGTTGFFSSYFELRHAREQSRKLSTEVDRLRLENQLLKNELATAQRVEAMAGFQAHTPSKTIGARVIGTTGGLGSKSILIDRGTASGVRKGMAVVTPDGIVGRVVAVYPFSSQVLAVTDPGFAAGVESQRNHVHGVVKGLGNETAKVDYIPTGQKVEVGEMFFTSGEDRVFPKGLAVGKVTAATEGSNFQDVFLQPTGVEAAPEEVLVIVDPVHQDIPEEPAADTPVFMAPDVKADATQPAQPAPRNGTQADQLLDQYQKLGEAQNHQFGEGGPGTPPPNFNIKVPGVNAPPGTPGAATPKPAAGAPGATAAPKPAAGGTGATAAPKPAAAATGTAGATGQPAAPRPRPTPQQPAVPPAPRPQPAAASPAPASASQPVQP
jgi:rod shape-determining protein MreC